MITITRAAGDITPTEDKQRHAVTGVAVPLEQMTEITRGYSELFERDAITLASEGVKFGWMHQPLPIGRVTATTVTDNALTFDAEFSDTTLARDIHALVADGVINRASIAGEITDWTDTETATGIERRIHAFTLREISLVDRPAYDEAEITLTRTKNGEINMSDTTNSAPAEAARLATLHDEIADVKRAFVELKDSVKRPEPQPVARDKRSAGEFLKDFVTSRGDDKGATAIARAYTGGKLEDDKLSEVPTFIKDLTRFYLAPSVIANIFNAEPLPATGKTYQFTRVAENTLKVASVTKDKEGETISTGKITTETITKDIELFAGGASLTIPEIEMSPTDMLDKTLRLMAIVAGRYRNDYYTKVFTDEVNALTDHALTVNAAVAQWKAVDVMRMLVDAAERSEDTGHVYEYLITDKDTFNQLATLTDSNGRPLMNVNGDSANSIGTVDIKRPTGTIFRYTVMPAFKAKFDETIKGALVAPEAFEKRESQLINLQGTTVLTLTRDFAVYGRGAGCLVYPDAVIPVKASA